ncbi:MAG: radical SAM protein [Culicoidibacterales bacterium]
MISFLIKPASSLCNMRCKYCFYFDVADHREIESHGKMKYDVMKMLITRALDYAGPYGNVQFAFQGGEPTIAGLDYFKAFIAEVLVQKKKQKVHYALQTNGLLLDEKWGELLSVHDFLVGISLDGYKENSDLFRSDIKRNSTYDRVIEKIELLKAFEVPFNILTVLTSNLARNPEKLYNFYKANELSHVQLIPCLGSLDSEKSSESALKPAAFAYFYKKFYQLWYDDYKNGIYMNISLFNDIIPMFRGIPPQQCGMLGFCSPQFVIESDGSIYPCDFYVLDKYACGNVLFDEIYDVLHRTNMQEFLSESKRMSLLCDNCQFREICNGGCKRQNIVYFTDDNYCGYRDFLQSAHESMREIASKIPLV